MAEPQIKEEELAEAERRARAALRGEPPSISQGEGRDRYTLEAGSAVLDYIREVGPPVVLKMAGEIRRLRAEEERLIERLRKVETWSLEGGRQ
jgi:hypothetical protein